MDEVIFQIRVFSELVRLGYDQEEVQRQVREWPGVVAVRRGDFKNGSSGGRTPLLHVEQVYWKPACHSNEDARLALPSR